MKIRINDLNIFEKTNGIYFTRDMNFQFEYEVYAIEGLKKNISYLILIQNTFNWVKNNDAIVCIDNSIDSNWIDTEKYIYVSKVDNQTMILKNISCPEWMTKEKTFLYDIFENPRQAFDMFKKNIHTENC